MLRDEANWKIRIAKGSSTPRVVEVCKSLDAVVVAIPLPDPRLAAQIPLAILTPGSYPQARFRGLKE